MVINLEVMLWICETLLWRILPLECPRVGVRYSLFIKTQGGGPHKWGEGGGGGGGGGENNFSQEGLLEAIQFNILEMIVDL